MFSKYFCSSFIRRHHLVGDLLLRRYAATTAQSNSSPPLQPHCMVDFLITNCGFSSDKATKVTSKHLSHLKSPDKPNSFLAFMRSHGFNDAHIRKILYSHPLYLCSDVENTLAPKFKSLHDLGFSASNIVHLIHSNPMVLAYDIDGYVIPKLKLWESLLGSRDRLMNLFKSNNGWFLLSDPKRVIPNMSLLRDCGIAAERVASLLRNYPAVILFRRTEELSAAIDQVKNKLGIDPSSGRFIPAVWSYSIIRESGFNAKLKLMKSFGLSEEEFFCAFRKTPIFVTYSVEMLTRKMDFLVKEAGCDPSDVIRRPILLMFSMNKRMIPRLNVMKFLKSKELTGREHKISTIMGYSNKQFMEMYVIPHKQQHPELHEMYMAVCDSGASL